MKQLFNITSSVQDKIPIDKLIEQHRPALLQYACYLLGNLEDAEDAVQDVYVQLHEYRVRPQSYLPSNPKAYLFRCLGNLCISQLRKQKRTIFVAIDEAKAQVDQEPQTFEEEYQRASRLLSQIPEEQAEVIRLRIYADLSFAEIADTLSLPLPTVKSRFLYGIQKIRSHMLATSTPSFNF